MSDASVALDEIEASRAPTPMTPHRLAALADGLFAIAMTLLVFELHTPAADVIHSSGDLVATLWGQSEKVLAFVMSFLVMGVYWVGHHNQFHTLRRVNRTFLWLNIVFLLLIALLPFSTGILGTFHQYQAAIVLYGAHLILIGFAFLVLFRYATNHKRLVGPEFDPAIAREATIRILLAPGFAFVAILVSFLSPTLAYALFFVALLPPLFSGKIDALLHGRKRP